jgi:hypothetical protein
VRRSFLPLRGQLLVLAGRPQELIIGTTDANDFVVKTNNSEALRITSAGNTGLGVTALRPTCTLKEEPPQEPPKLTDGPLYLL